MIKKHHFLKAIQKNSFDVAWKTFRDIFCDVEKGQRGGGRVTLAPILFLIGDAKGVSTIRKGGGIK